MPSRDELVTGWTLSGADLGPVPATVPGCVHTDLLAAGLIEDPHLDDNEALTGWIGFTDWRYRTGFAGAADGDQVDLVLHGLDTVASVTLNGEHLGDTENMHRSYRFPITGLLAERNELTVDLASAERFAAARVAETGGPRPNPFDRPYAAIRKMACNFGWDWGPDLVTAGIWRPVEVHRWRTARFDRVRPLLSREGAGWLVEVHVDLVRTDPVPVAVTARVAGVEAHMETTGDSVVLRLTVADPAVWWPIGYGEQPRYPLEVILDAGGEILDEWSCRIGFRSVALDTTDDGFVLRVNDKAVFARGVNWIPDDTFVTRVTPARYRQRLRQAVDANVNLVRVWGGGLYESDDFYDACDEFGLLVWQDFPFACSAYSEDERLAAEIEAEARENIVRLGTHPSLVLWNGNNENIWGWFDWDWPDLLDGRSWGRRYYLELLPRLVAELDPTRPYWAGSPYSGSMDRHPNDDRYGVSHVWDVWNEKDYLAYRDRTPRFVAEFGYQGPPTLATLSRKTHQKALDGDAKLERGLAEHFGPVEGFDDWHFLTQVNQARAVTVGVTHFRSAQPRCMGTIWWQLNDCWPGPSWSVVDGGGRPKPAWYALRDAYRPRLASIQPSGAGSGLDLVIVNDTDESWIDLAVIARHDFDGSVRASMRADIRCPPRSVQRIAVDSDVARPEHPDRELVRASHAGEWFFLSDKDLRYPKASFTVRREGPDIEVTAGTLLRDLCLLNSESVVDGMPVLLLPGETARFRSSGAPLLRCVNDIERAAV